ncbi:hypothetical protein KKA23_01455 [Patescibacteria group bacterium]|nr:hypothetical protein [Patescibacteria group bacterium]MBU3922950.1 hypothetical protein [Patescibacteria group bacterium]
MEKVKSTFAKRFKDRLNRKKELAEEFLETKELLKNIKERIILADNTLNLIIKNDIDKLSSLILKQKKRHYLFEIWGWKIKDNSSLRVVNIEFRLFEILFFSGLIDIQKDVLGPFMRIIQLRSIKDFIEKMNEDYKTKFVISCIYDDEEHMK